MSSAVKIGFSMHPRWLGGGDLNSFIAPLRQAGLNALEFELDPNLPEWPEFAPLMEAAAGLGLDLSFHAPFRAPHTLNGFSGSQHDAIAADYCAALAIAERWAVHLGSDRTVVIHAATAALPADRERLETDTREFLRWALDCFPHLCFALENNAPAREHEIKVGDRLTGVLDLVDTLRAERLVACWDMGHDMRVRGPSDPPQEWLTAVGHVHVHDIDERGEDHFPLVYQRVPYEAWLRKLIQVGNPRMVVLELIGSRLNGWPFEKIGPALIHSVSELKRITEIEP